MTQAQPERPQPEGNVGTRILTAFGETPAQIQTELQKAFERFGASLPEHQGHWLASPAQGRWSPAQVCEHVLIVNEGVSRIVSLLLSDKTLRPAPTTPGETVGGRRVAPAGLEPGAGTSWAELEPRWQASQTFLTGLAARLGDANLSRRYFHPFLGELDAHDWVRMATFHTRHHRRQLSEGQPEERAAE